ncbi:hypothetical protein EGI22_12420 [Lacihabitans sp. LS3-19]|nr:hypothetical protein [Lacihabitans sp. LS3-19]
MQNKLITPIWRFNICIIKKVELNQNTFQQRFVKKTNICNFKENRFTLYKKKLKPLKAKGLSIEKK